MRSLIAEIILTSYRKQIDFPNDILEGDINWKHVRLGCILNMDVPQTHRCDLSLSLSLYFLLTFTLCHLVRRILTWGPVVLSW